MEIAKNKFDQFLADHVTDSKAPSHTSIEPNGKYDIADGELEQFFELYTDYAINHNGTVNITERQCLYGPILIDIDFKYAFDNDSSVNNNKDIVNNDFPEAKMRRHSEYHIKSVIYHYFNIARRYLCLDDTRKNVVLVFHRPDAYIKDGIIKDGIHMIFPELICDKYVRHMIYYDVINALEQDNPFVKESKGVENEPPCLLGLMDNSPKSIIDKAVVSVNNWTLYGSRKKETMPYKLSHIYTITSPLHNGQDTLNRNEFYCSNIISERSNIEWYSERQLPKYLSIRGKCAKDALHYISIGLKTRVTDWYKSNEAPKRIVDKPIDPNKEQIVDVSPQTVKGKAMANISNSATEVLSLLANGVSPLATAIATSKVSMAEVSALVDMLSDDRAYNHDTWIRVGWCLYAIGNGTDEYFTLFVKFSAKANKDTRTEEACTALWTKSKISDTPIGIGSLRYWAREDNPEKYKAYKRNSIFDILDSDEYSNCLDVDIANVVYMLYEGRFVCASIVKQKNGSVWYEFRGHKWVEIDAGHTLNSLLSTEVYDLIVYMAKRFNAKATSLDVTDEPKQKGLTSYYTSRRDSFNAASKKLKTSNGKSAVMRELALKFYKEKFEDTLNTNPYLLCFNNGVYDLKTLQFRPGCYDDYVSRSTGLDYIPYSELIKTGDGSIVMRKIERFISQIMPDKKEREYLKVFLGSSIRGVQPEKFYIWTGSGGNGKTILITLLSYALGEYHGEASPSLLQNGRVSSEKANPDLIAIKGKRLVGILEPDDTKELNVNYMKFLVGNDKMIARGLFKECESFYLQCCFVMVCNNMPLLPPSAANDGGTWRRIAVLGFNSKFVDNPSDDPALQEFKIDNDLKDDIKSWGPYFASYLVEQHRIFVEEYKCVIPTPQSVKNKTTEYQKDNDCIYSYNSEHVIKGSPTDSVKINDYISYFNDWYRDEYNTRVPTKKAVKDYFSKFYGTDYKVRTSTLVGYKHITVLNEQNECIFPAESATDIPKIVDVLLYDSDS
jgi:P4 family phage/plasmid primase-like protien